MPVVLVAHKEDPAKRINRAVGEIDDIEVFNNKVLVGLYVRGDKKKEVVTKGGIVVPMPVTDEDDYQSKVGLILKMGPTAFLDKNEPQRWFIDQDDMKEGNWVWFRSNSGFPVTLVHENKGQKVELLCRLLDDTAIVGRTTSAMGPDRIY